MLGTLLAPLKLLFGAVLVLATVTLAAWIIDWFFVSYVWPDGLARLKTILVEDLGRAARLSASNGASPHLAERAANLLYGLVFESTGIHQMGARFADASRLSIPDTVVRNAYVENFRAIEVAMVGTQLLGVRVAMLAMATPLLVLAYVAAMVDGLAQRAIRRASGGRESASLYHRAKHLQLGALVALAAVALLLPMSLDPRLMWGIGALAMGIAVRLQWMYYKKHL